MKRILFIICCLAAYQCHAQKFILLDTHISEPPFYADRITTADKLKGYFPVEKKDLPDFIKILEDISRQLSAKNNSDAKQYHLGCISFNGLTFRLSSGKSLDYVLTSVCEHVKIVMHLCDGKIGNADNAYFVNTWIKYIKAAIR